MMLYLVLLLLFSTIQAVYFTSPNECGINVAIGNRAVDNTRASKSGDGRTLCSSKTSFDGFLISKAEKFSVGRGACFIGSNEVNECDQVFISVFL